jgi:hypothetical protein
MQDTYLETFHGMKYVGCSRLGNLHAHHKPYGSPSHGCHMPPISRIHPALGHVYHNYAGSAVNPASHLPPQVRRQAVRVGPGRPSAALPALLLQLPGLRLVHPHLRAARKRDVRAAGRRPPVSRMLHTIDLKNQTTCSNPYSEHVVPVSHSIHVVKDAPAHKRAVRSLYVKVPGGLVPARLAVAAARGRHHFRVSDDGRRQAYRRLLHAAAAVQLRGGAWWGYGEPGPCGVVYESVTWPWVVGRLVTCGRGASWCKKPLLVRATTGPEQPRGNAALDGAGHGRHGLPHLPRAGQLPPIRR